MQQHEEEALREYDDLRDPAGDPELEAVKAAIFLEDLLGVTLGDDDIDLLRRPTGMREILTRIGGTG